MGELRVTFCENVEVYILPYEEQRDAWLARHGPWLCAPKHDELWDGETKTFRPQELTKAELRRLVIDMKVRKVLPSSIFHLYRKSRDMVHEAEKKRRASKSRGKNKKKTSKRRQSDTVPEKFIDDLVIKGESVDENSVPEETLISRRYSDDSSVSTDSNSSEADGNRRWSLTKTIRRSLSKGSKMFEKNVSLNRSPSTASNEMAEIDNDSLPWLERIHQLDGLTNTKVQRSAAVDNIWDQLSDHWYNLQLLGQSLIWDGQYLLREIWPGNPLDPTVAV